MAKEESDPSPDPDPDSDSDSNSGESSEQKKSRVKREQFKDRLKLKYYDCMVIGVSLGGLEGLAEVIPQLPADFSMPVLIVQHLHPDSDGYYPRTINDKSVINVKEAEDGEELKPGNVYFAPGDRHLMVTEDHKVGLSSNTADKVNSARPAIDVLFKSAAPVYGKRLVGVIMTGSTDDGARGMKAIKDAGGHTIAQDPATCVNPTMPNSAIRKTKINHVVKLEILGTFLAGYHRIFPEPVEDTPKESESETESDSKE